MRKILLSLSVWLAVAGCSPASETPPEDPLEQGKADAQKLVAAMVPEIEGMLSEGGFAPLARAMLADGTIAPVEAADGDGADAERRLAALHQALKQKAAAGELKAAALAYPDTASLPDAADPLDAVAIDIDHPGGYSVTLLFPYNLEDGVVRWKAPQSEPGRHRVFAR